MNSWRLATSFLTCTLIFVVAAAPVAAEDPDRTDADATYLALGDSVAFGFNPLLDPRVVANFVGYPEALASRSELTLTNASCPGEASGGFISLTGLDNGCRPYSAAFHLHVSYTTSQLDFAVAFLRAHPRTRLVTLDIGANDLFKLQQLCAGATTCIQSGIPVLLQTLASNVARIYTRIRVDAHYHHQLVALTYYVVNFNDPLSVGLIQAINATIAQATRTAGGDVADGFDAFKAAASPAGGDACAAGLLIVKSAAPRVCDIHPSPLGRDVLANVIADTLRDRGED